MNLFKKAKKAAKKNGRKINTKAAKGLKAVQIMHDMCKRHKGSPYKILISRKGK